MNLLPRLAGVLGLGLVLQLSCCTSTRHDAQAPPRARHTYHKAERQHTRARRRTTPLNLPWN